MNIIIIYLNAKIYYTAKPTIYDLTSNFRTLYNVFTIKDRKNKI
jgi:hypothetical protein